MAEGTLAEEGKSAKDVFAEAVPEFFRILGQKPPFIALISSLNCEGLITDDEDRAIREVLTSDDRGDAMAQKLKDRIRYSDDPVACLLKICDVFESEGVQNPTLKNYGAKMRDRISRSEANPTATHTLGAYQVNELNEGCHQIPFKASEAILLLRNASFRFTMSFHNLLSELCIPTDMKERLKTQAKYDGHDCEFATEKAIDWWMANNIGKSWEDFFDIIKKCEPETAQKIEMNLKRLK